MRLRHAPATPLSPSPPLLCPVPGQLPHTSPCPGLPPRFISSPSPAARHPLPRLPVHPPRTDPLPPRAFPPSQAAMAAPHENSLALPLHFFTPRPARPLFPIFFRWEDRPSARFPCPRPSARFPWLRQPAVPHARTESSRPGRVVLPTPVTLVSPLRPHVLSRLPTPFQCGAPPKLYAHGMRSGNSRILHDYIFI